MLRIKIFLGKEVKKQSNELLGEQAENRKARRKLLSHATSGSLSEFEGK